MKLSYGIPLIDDLSLEELEHYLALLQEIGYEGVECSVCRAADLPKEAIRELLDKYSLRFSGFRSGAVYDRTGVRFSSPDPAVRQKAVKMINQVVDLCAYFDCPLLLGRVQGLLEDGEDLVQAKEWIKECIRQVARHAGETGVPIAYEPINRFEMNYNHTTKEMVAYIQEINAPLSHKVGLLMDVYHMAMEDNSIAAAFVRSIPYIVHVHFRDSNNGVPGSGTIDFADAVKVLDAMEYKGWIALEVAFDFCDYEKGARDSMAYLAPLIAAAQQCR